ncbi:MAG TPA: VOC family protein [Nitrobacter sp.]|nr:VOC family protein [Nitrobacter sp.]
MATDGEGFIVGGVRLPRPFRIRRLGHFGLDLDDPEAGRVFYERLLGFRVSDPLDWDARLPPAERGRHGPGRGYFMRHGTDHHSFVLFPRRVRRALFARPGAGEEVTVNQVTWQVGSLKEVVDGHRWLAEKSIPIVRSGRDTPGSNWHVYPLDPTGHANELYYGIEQVGWDGLSKPEAMHEEHFDEPPALPRVSEYAEVEARRSAGIDAGAGWRQHEPDPEIYEVGGVLLARPFKVVKIGPVRLFVPDIEAALAFYRDLLGLMVTEEIDWHGHRCVFLRANTEHHSLALYPLALRGELGLSPRTTLFSFGVELGGYDQLRAAVPYLRDAGVGIRRLPPELFPGIDYSAFARDPDGHLVQLYYTMEQVGWDGRPRPAAERPAVDNDHWPETVAARSDTFLGEALLGPWN